MKKYDFLIFEKHLNKPFAPMELPKHQLPHLLITLCFLLLFHHRAAAQIDCKNLLPNPSFEENTGLPDDYAQWFKVKDWNNINLNMGFAGFGSPDFLHTDAPNPGVKLPDSEFGFIFPHTGKAIFNIALWTESLPDFREYLSAKLLEPLIPGVQYEVSFWISNGEMNYGGAGSNGLGVCFSETPLLQIKHETLTNANPQWMTQTVLYEPDWHEIKFKFVADKAYQYFSIGGFLSDLAQTLIQFEPVQGDFKAVNYLVDDFSVKKVLDAFAIVTGAEASVCLGDSIELKAPDWGQTNLWSTGDSAASIFVYQPGIYSLVSSGICGSYTDSIEVFRGHCEKAVAIPNAFTPNGDAANDAFTIVPDSNYQVEKLRIFNRWGSLVFDSAPGNISWDGTIEGQPASSDVYIYWFEIRNMIFDSIEVISGELSLLR